MRESKSEDRNKCQIIRDYFKNNRDFAATSDDINTILFGFTEEKDIQVHRSNCSYLRTKGFLSVKHKKCCSNVYEVSRDQLKKWEIEEHKILNPEPEEEVILTSDEERKAFINRAW